jgi:hypothetical protein
MLHVSHSLYGTVQNLVIQWRFVLEHELVKGCWFIKSLAIACPGASITMYAQLSSHLLWVWISV